MKLCYLCVKSQYSTVMTILGNGHNIYYNFRFYFLFPQVKSKRELVAFLLSDFLLLTTPSKSVSSCTTLATLERALTSTTCAMYRKVSLSYSATAGCRDTN